MLETGSLSNIASRWLPKLQECRAASPEDSVALGPEKLIDLFAMLAFGYVVAFVVVVMEAATRICRMDITDKQRRRRFNRVWTFY